MLDASLKRAADVAGGGVPGLALSCNVVLDKNLQVLTQGEETVCTNLHAGILINLEFARVHGWAEFRVELAGITFLLCVPFGAGNRIYAQRWLAIKNQKNTYLSIC